MNRKGSAQHPNELLNFVKSNCKHLLGPAFWDVRYLCRVEVGWKHDRLEARILALSKFRLFFLSGKAVSKLQVESNFHLLNLTSVESVSETQLVCAVEDGRKLHIRLVGTSKSIDLARALLQAIKHYFPNCADSLKLFLELKPPQLYAEFAVLPSVKPSLPCENFRRTYAALCDLYKLPFRDEVGWDVDKIYACHDNRVLRLEDFNHLNSRDLVPIVAVLQFNSWFNGLVVENIRIHGEKELQDVLRDVLKRSQWLKILRLCNCGLKSDFLLLLSQAFQANQTLPLAVIDLSRNTFDEHKAAIHLGNSLSSLSHGLKEVYFVDCGLNTKAVNGLANGLFTSQLNASSLRRLSFGGNSLKEDANDIHSLLSRCQILEELDLSSTGIPLEKLWSALKYGGLCLKTLNLSGCAFSTKKSNDPAKASSLKDFFASAVALKVLDLSDSNLPSEMLKCLLLGLACNQELSNIELNLSKSCLDKKSVPVLEASLPNVRAVEKLILRDNSFDQDLSTLLPAVGKMPCLVSLDLGGNNFHGVRKHQPKQLTSLLMELVKIINEEDTRVRELGLGDCRLGVHLSVLLNALGPSPCLRYLDISGNEMGNFGARLLAKALQINASLESVILDKNQITFEGYADILHALKDNSSVISMPYPLLDAFDSFSRGERDKMQHVLAEIGKLLERNQASRNKSRKSETTERSFLTQSRLTLGNMEEELNRIEYSSQQLLSDCSQDSSEVDVANVKTLVDDAEKTKHLLVSMLPLFENDEFIDDLVDTVSAQIRTELQHKLKATAGAIGAFPAQQGLSVCTKQDFTDSLVEISGRRAQLDISSGVADFKKYLRNEFSAVSMNVAHAVTGEVIKEVSLDLAAASKKLGLVVKSASLNSLNQPAPTSPSPSASLTPKTKRKQKLFQRSSRPKSIVGQPEEGAVETLSVEMSSSDEFAPTFDALNDSGSSLTVSMEEDKTSESDVVSEVPVKLSHMQKARPKNPNKRMPTRHRKPSAQSEIDSGLADFFGTEKGNPARTPVGKETSLPTLSELDESCEDNAETKFTVKSPPGGIRVITAEMLQKKKPQIPEQILSPPRAPPNTPMTPKVCGGRDSSNVDSRQETPTLFPPKLPWKPKSDAPREEEKNGWVVLTDSEDGSQISKTSSAGTTENEYAEIDKSTPGSANTEKTEQKSKDTSEASVLDSSSTSETSGLPTESTSSTESSITRSGIETGFCSVSSSQWESSKDSLPPKSSESVTYSKPGLPPKPELPSEGLVRMRNINSQPAVRPKTQLIGGSGDMKEEGVNGEGPNKKDQRKSVMDLKGMFEKQQPPKPAPRSKNKISPSTPSQTDC